MQAASHRCCRSSSGRASSKRSPSSARRLQRRLAAGRMNSSCRLSTQTARSTAQMKLLAQPPCASKPQPCAGAEPEVAPLRAPAATRRAAQQLFDRQQALRVNQLQQAQLQMEALLLAVIQIVKGAQHNLQIARQLFFGKQQRRPRCARALVARRSAAAPSARRPAWPSARCAGSAPSAAPATTGCARHSPAHSTAPSARRSGPRPRLPAAARRPRWAPRPSARESARRRAPAARSRQAPTQSPGP